MIILKNPSSSPIRNCVYGEPGKSKIYSIESGETLIFEDDVGNFLKERYPFLQEVEIKQKGGLFKCSECEYTHNEKFVVWNHMKRSHPDKNPENIIENKDQSEPVMPDGVKKAEGKPYTSREQQLRQNHQDYYADLGIPVGNKKDKDGVEWYGEGLTEDNPHE